MNLSLNSLNTDFQGLQDTRLTWDPYNTKFTGDDFGGKGVIGRDISTGVGLGTSIGAGAGAALGSTLGSWAGPAGAGLGALLGVIAGGIAGGVKKNNAEKRAESMNATNSFLNQQANNEFNNTATNIATNNWLNTMKQNSFEFGGILNQASPYTEYNAGGSHQSNPLGGIMVGIGENGLPNKVEEGEVKYKDYVFSNKTKPSKEFQKHYKIKDKTFAEIFKTYMKAAKETENDPITKKGTEQFAKALMMEQEKVKQMEAAAQQQALQEQQAALYQNPDTTIPTESSSEVPQDANLFTPGGKLKNFFKNWGTEKNDFDPINDGNLLTMSTLIPQGISVIDSLLTQPDYSAANAIAEAGRNLSYVTPTILTDRMEYTPIDTNRYLSSLRNNAAANRNQIRNIAGANRVVAMAALQGSNRDQVTAIGELMPQLEAMNEARRNQAIQFNAGINARNAAARAQADAQNMQVEQAKYNATLQALAAKEAEDKLNAQQRNQNLTSFVTNLGALGTELSNAERLRYLKDNTDMFGNFKGDSSETFGNTPETTLQNAVNNNVSNSPLNINPSNLLDINTSSPNYTWNPATVPSAQQQVQQSANPASLIPTGLYENIKYGEGDQSSIPSNLAIDLDIFNRGKNGPLAETPSNIGSQPTVSSAQTTPMTFNIQPNDDVNFDYNPFDAVNRSLDPSPMPSIYSHTPSYLQRREVPDELPEFNSPHKYSYTSHTPSYFQRKEVPENLPESNIPILGPWLDNKIDYDHSPFDAVNRPLDPPIIPQSKGITTPPGQKISTPPVQRTTNLTSEKLYYNNQNTPYENLDLSGDWLQAWKSLTPKERKEISGALGFPHKKHYAELDYRDRKKLASFMSYITKNNTTEGYYHYPFLDLGPLHYPLEVVDPMSKYPLFYNNNNSVK